MEVYLDHAASTPLSDQVLEAMLPHFRQDQGNPSSIHSHGRKLRSSIEQARSTVADLLGCSPAELIFTSGGTEADNYAIKCSVQQFGLRQIITSPLEHHAVLHAAEWAAAKGNIPLRQLTPDREGQLDLDELQSWLAEEPQSLVTLMHANNEMGGLNDIRAIGALCEEYGAVFHSDTVQSIGLYQPNLAELPVHYVVASAHKFNGPKGVGFLYCQPGYALEPFLHGGGQERNQRAGTENVAGIAGLAEALRLTYESVEQKREALTAKRSYLKEWLQSVFPELALNGPQAPGRFIPSVLNVAFPGEDTSGMLLMNLDIYGISASGGSACTSGTVEGSHVLEAMGHDERRVANSIRFSFGPETSYQELDYVIQKLCQIYQRPVPEAVAKAAP